MKKVVFDTSLSMDTRLDAAYDVSWDLASNSEDSIELYLNFIYDNSINSEDLLHISRYYVIKTLIGINENDTISALSYCDSASKYAEIGGLNRIRLWSITKKGELLERLDLQIDFFDSIIKSNDWSNDLNYLFDLYYKLAIKQTDIGDFKNGIKSLDSTLKYIKLFLNKDSSYNNLLDYANILTVTGTVYKDRALKVKNNISINENCNEAIFYYEQAQLIYEKIDFKKYIALIYSNKAEIYLIKEDFNKAINNLKKSLNISLDLDDKEHIAHARILMSKILISKKDYQHALYELYKANKLFSKYEIEYDEEFHLVYGSLYDSLNDLNKAIYYYEQAYKVVNKNSFLGVEKVSKTLYRAYKKQGRSKEALEMYKEYISNRDTLSQMNALDEIMRNKINREYTLRQQQDSIEEVEQAKLNLVKLDLQNTQLRNEKNIRIGIVIILLIITVFAILILLKYRESINQKNIIEKQKKSVDEAYENLKIKKRELEVKKKEIMDSIHYAKYIQKALLPTEEELKNYFDNQFVFYWPKDIVSGDFYWFKAYGDLAILVVADCTGHGVPGGFITMLGSLLIKHSVKDKTKDPNKVLSDVNRGIVTLLKQHRKDSIQDGMDVAVCLIDKKNRNISFSGSRNGLYIVKKDSVDSYKGDLCPVGGYFNEKSQFSEREYKMQNVELKKGEWVFMSSDGFYDQFGGPKNKSMGSGRFKNLLKDSVAINKTSSSDYKDYFFNWMGDEEQIDDVLVFGFSL